MMDRIALSHIAFILLSACGGADSTSPVADSGQNTTGAEPQLIEQLHPGEWLAPIEKVEGSEGRIDIDGIDADQTGDVFLTGYFSGPVNFGRPSPYPPLVSTRYQNSATFTKDAFIAKYSAAGNLIFAKQISSTGFEGDGYDLATDTRGNAYVSGAFSGVMSVSDSMSLSTSCAFGVTSGNSGANGQLFLIKYDTLGNPQWAIQSDSQSTVAGGNEVSVDANGDVIQIAMIGGIPANTNTNQIFGCSQRLVQTPKSTLQGTLDIPYDGGAGGYDTFIAVYNQSNGQVLNGFIPLRIAGTGRQRGKAIDKSANSGPLKTYVFGVDYTGPTVIRTATGAIDLMVQKDGVAPQEYSQNIVVGRASYDGKLLWKKAFGSASFDEVKGIGTDSQGNVIVGGTISGDTTGDIQIAKSATLPASVKSAGFVMKLNGTDGSLIWARVFGGENSAEICCEVIVGEADSIFLSPQVTGGQFYFTGLSAPLVFKTGAPEQIKGLTLHLNTAGQLLSARLTPHGPAGARSHSGEMAFVNKKLYVTPSFFGELLAPASFPSAGGGRDETELLIKLNY